MPEKNPLVDLDVVHGINLLPNEDPNKPLFGAICLAGLCTGMRAISFANLCLGDFSRYRIIPNTNQHEVHLKIRVVKGDPNSDLVVRFVDPIVGDVVDENDDISKNVMYWLGLYLKKNYNLLWSDIDRLDPALKVKSLFQRNEDQLYAFITNTYEKVLGYPKGYFCFHSLRSGYITSVLLNNSNGNTEIANANIVHAARIGAWSTNGDNMIHYLKQSHGYGIAANSVVFNRATAAVKYNNPTEYHGISLPTRIESANYYANIFENRTKFNVKLGYNSCLISTSTHNKGSINSYTNVSRSNFVEIFHKREVYELDALMVGYFRKKVLTNEKVVQFLQSNRDYRSFIGTGKASKRVSDFIGLLCANGIGNLHDYLFSCYQYALTASRISGKLSFLWHDRLLMDDDSEMAIKQSFEIAMDAFPKKQYLALHSEIENTFESLWILSGLTFSNRSDFRLMATDHGDIQRLLNLYVITHCNDEGQESSYCIGIDNLLYQHYQKQCSTFLEDNNMIEVENGSIIKLKQNYNSKHYNKSGEDISNEAMDNMFDVALGEVLAIVPTTLGEVYATPIQNVTTASIVDPSIVRTTTSSSSSSSSSSSRAINNTNNSSSASASNNNNNIRSKNVPPANLHAAIVSRNSNDKSIRLEWTTFLSNSFYYFHDIFEAPVYPNSSAIRYQLCEFCFEYMCNVKKVYDQRELYYSNIPTEMQCRNKYQNDSKSFNRSDFINMQASAKQYIVALRENYVEFDADVNAALKYSIGKYNSLCRANKEIDIQSLSAAVVNEKTRILNGNHCHSFQVTETTVVNGDIQFKCKFSPTKNFAACVRNNQTSNVLEISGNDLINGEDIEGRHFKKILQSLITHVVQGVNNSDDKSNVSEDPMQQVIISSEMEQALTLTSTAARKIPVKIATETSSASQSQDLFVDLSQFDNDDGGNHSNKRVLESSNGTVTSDSPTNKRRFFDLINDEEYDTVGLLNFTQTEQDDAGDDDEVVDASLTTNSIERRSQFYDLLFDYDVDITDEAVVFLEQRCNRGGTPVGICVQDALNYYYENMQS